MLIALALFLALGAHQLHLPGLHYDEAKEAGLNALELITGQPVSAFRDAALVIGPWRFPLMVQDYIGSLNVLLAIPFLALGGVSAVALRWLPLVIGGLTILATWRVARRLGGAVSAGAAALLLAASPSFVFWSRQGIFVTNLTALLLMAGLLAAVRWWQTRRPRDLWFLALLLGLGLYAKLLFAWAVGALAGLAVLAWIVSSRSEADAPAQAATAPPRKGSAALTLAVAMLCFLLPLAPLILFNIRTGGTLASVFGSLGRSYYGVDNSAYWMNLQTRLRQLLTLLRGDHFWYLGGIYANVLAPWLAGLLVGGGIVVGSLRWRRWQAGKGSRYGDGPHPLSSLVPVVVLLLAVAQSAFTVSDLFITHYAMLAPLVPLAAGLAAGELVYSTRSSGPAMPSSGKQGLPAPEVSSGRSIRRRALAALALVAVLLWAGADLWTTLRYHRALSLSGGHAAHSDAVNRLADYLDRGGLSAPVALDWGIDAPVRFLTAGRVRPVEVFGYSSLDAPDAGFADRLSGFLANPDSVYLAHTPENTVFGNRWEALQALATARGLVLREEMTFAERSGRPLFVVYRATQRMGSGFSPSIAFAYNDVSHSLR